MRATFSDKVERARFESGPYASKYGERCGAFEIIGPYRVELRIIASDGNGDAGAGWQHVSVSTAHRPPNWAEMVFVKQLFFDDEETVVQFHPAKSQYVNCHPHCLHLWRPPYPTPLPPRILIGP